MSFKLGCVQGLDALYRTQRTGGPKKPFHLQITFIFGSQLKGRQLNLLQLVGRFSALHQGITRKIVNMSDTLNM